MSNIRPGKKGALTDLQAGGRRFESARLHWKPPGHT